MPFHAGAEQGATAGALAGGVPGAIIGGLFGIAGGLLSRKRGKKQRKRRKRAVAAAQQFARGRQEAFEQNPLFQKAQQFISQSFEEGAENPFARDVGLSIRASQASRGLFTGNLAAIQEAQGRSAFTQRLRQQLVPAATRLAGLPEQVRQTALTSALSQGQIEAASAVDPNAFEASLQGGLAGAFGGFQIASTLRQQAISGQQGQERSQLINRLLTQDEEEQGGLAGAGLSPLISQLISPRNRSRARRAQRF